MSARRRARRAPRSPTRPVACGHDDHGRKTQFGVKLTLADAIRDLSLLQEAKSDRFDLVTSLLHTCVHRELEQRMDDAEQRRTRFTLVKGKGA